MTKEEAAKILRTISEKNLPTVDGIPFPEIKKALIMGAAVLNPIEEHVRHCEKCKHRKPKRTESGTVYGCESWECKFEERDDFPNVVNELPEPSAFEKSLDDEVDIMQKGRWRG